MLPWQPFRLLTVWGCPAGSKADASEKREDDIGNLDDNKTSWLGLKPGASRQEIEQYVREVHVGTGHPSPAELAQTFKDAGAAIPLVRAARSHVCPICDVFKTPKAQRVARLPVRSRRFNQNVTLDFVHLVLHRDGQPVRKITALTVMDEWSGLVSATYLPTAVATAASEVMREGWYRHYGCPDNVFVDPDSIFKSDEFTAALRRRGIHFRTTAAQAHWQFGRHERFHKTLRRMAQTTYKTVDDKCTVQEVLDLVCETRNAQVRVKGVSPYVLVFGHQPRHWLDAGEGGGEYDTDALVAGLLQTDNEYATVTARRQAAAQAWLRHLTLDGLDRAKAARPRPYRGRYGRRQC